MVGVRILVCVVFSTFILTPIRADNWPAWRGPNGDGVSLERNLPLTWNATDNVRWKVALPQPCNSTPIIWGDHVFLTQGLYGGKRRAVIPQGWQETLAKGARLRFQGNVAQAKSALLRVAGHRWQSRLRMVRFRGRRRF